MVGLFVFSIGQVSGQDELRLDDAEYQADDDDVADHREETGHATGGEYQWQKRRHRGQHAKDDGNGNFPGPVDGGLYGRLTHLFVGVDAFADDDGVVDENAEHQNERHDGHRGYGDVGVRKDGQRTEQRDRNARSDPHRQSKA